MHIKSPRLGRGLRVALRRVSPYRRDITVLIGFGIAGSLLNASVPYIAGRMFDEIIRWSTLTIGTVALPAFLVFFLLWLVIQLGNYGLDWLVGLRSQELGAKVEAGYFTDAFDHILLLPLSFHKTHRIGKYWDKITRGRDGLWTLTTACFDLLPDFLSIGVALGLAFWINPLLATFLLGGLVIYLIFLVDILLPSARLQKRMQRAYNEAYGNAHEAAANIAAVKQAGAEDYESRRVYRGLHLRAGRFWLEISAVWRSLSLIQRLTILMTQAGIFVFSVIAIRVGTMTIGELVTFNAYAAMLFGPFVALGHRWQTIQNGFIALGRAEKILQLPEEPYQPARAIAVETPRGAVEFQHVEFSYESRKPVLRDISFSVRSGETVALVGESGVGKSTLIELISGYYFPRRGHVLIDGVDTRHLDLKALRSRIAVVPQEVTLFNDTIEKNIRYGSFQATMEAVEHAATLAHAHEFITAFPKQYKQLVGERGVKLSVGQKQRLAIARAILRDPKILVLDEPTSALDAGSEKAIERALETLMTGRTTFIIAHRLSTVRRADTIIVLKDGRIVEQGTHDELRVREGGEYRRLYELQIGLHE